MLSPLHPPAASRFTHKNTSRRRHLAGKEGGRRHEAQPPRHQLPPEVPQRALSGPVLRPPRAHVRGAVDGAPPQVQRALRPDS
jgi:hypothetical protein